ncbi:MAG: hypothetical protein MUO50_19255, partial [Longimicrobiales bacterium]|nr:hypothetical protein [Longimicrobiales bacterium]
FGPLDLLEGGWLLLCSDGLHGVMPLDEIDAFLVRQADAERAAAGLVEEALARKTGDNVSVALACWPDPSAMPASSGGGRSSGGRRSPEKAWRPERILIRSPRSKPSRSTVALAIRVLLVVVPLTIALVFLFDWIFSLAP